MTGKGMPGFDVLFLDDGIDACPCVDRSRYRYRCTSSSLRLRGHFENAIALIFRNSSASGYSCAGFLPCGEHERSFYFWHYKQDIFPRTIPNTMITAQHLLATPFASTMDCSGVACVSQAHAYRIDADYFCGLSIRSTYFSGTTTLDEDLQTTVSVTFG